MPDKQLGFIGVGRMGQHMASRLIEAGFRGQARVKLVCHPVFDLEDRRGRKGRRRGAFRSHAALIIIKLWDEP